MNPHFQAEVQKLLKQESSFTEQYNGPRRSTFSWKKPHHVVPIVKTEREKQQEKDGVLLDSAQEIRNIPELHHVREEYCNLKSLSQIAQENLKCKRAHLLSLQQQLKREVDQLKQEETVRVDRHKHVQTLVDIKRKARVLKLKIQLCGENIGIIEKRRERMREDYEKLEEKLKNTEDIHHLEFMNQRNYLRVEVQEFKTKEKDFRFNISKCEISNQETTRWEELNGKELQLKTDVAALTDTLQELMTDFKNEREKIIANHAHDIERLEAENQEMLRDIARIESSLREKNETMLQFMNHTKRVDYSNHASFEESISGDTRIVFDQPKTVTGKTGHLTSKTIKLNRIDERDIQKLANDGETVNANKGENVQEIDERNEVLNIEDNGNLEAICISSDEDVENIERQKNEIQSCAEQNERFRWSSKNKVKSSTVESFEDGTLKAVSCETNTTGESHLRTNEDVERIATVAMNVKASGKLPTVLYDKESRNDMFNMSLNSADHPSRSEKSELNLHSSHQPQTNNTDLDDPMNSSSQTIKQIDAVQSVAHVFKRPSIIQTGNHFVSRGQTCVSEPRNSLERDMQKELQQFVELNTDRNNVNTNSQRGFISNVEARFAPGNILCTQRSRSTNVLNSSSVQTSATPVLQGSTTPIPHRDTKPQIRTPSTLQRSVTPSFQRSSTPAHRDTTHTKPQIQTPSTLQRSATPNFQRSSTPAHRDRTPQYKTPSRSVTPNSHRETKPDSQCASSNEQRFYIPEDYRSTTPTLRLNSTPHTPGRNTGTSRSCLRGNHSLLASPSILFPSDTDQAAKACNEDRLSKSPVKVQQWHATNQSQSHQMTEGDIGNKNVSKHTLNMYLNNEARPINDRFKSAQPSSNVLRNEWSKSVNMDENKSYGNSRELVPNRNMVNTRPQKDGHHLTDGHFKITTQLSFKLCNTIVPRELNSGKIVLKNTVTSDGKSEDMENNHYGKKAHQFRDRLIETESKSTRQKRNAGQNFKIRGDIRVNVQQTNVEDISNSAHDLNAYKNEIPKALSNTNEILATKPNSLVRNTDTKFQEKGSTNSVQNITSHRENKVGNNQNTTHLENNINKIDFTHSHVQNTSDRVNDGNAHIGDKDIQRQIDDEQNQTSSANLNKERNNEPNNADTKDINSFDNKLKQFLLGQQESMGTNMSCMKLMNKPREILLKKKPGTTHLKRVKNVKFNSKLNQVYEGSPLHEASKRKSDTGEDKPKKRRSRKLFSLDDED